MKTARVVAFVFAFSTCITFSDAGGAETADAGRAAAGDDAGAGSSSHEASSRADAATSTVPLACGGALCETTTGSMCSLTLGVRTQADGGMALTMALLLFRARRRARSRSGQQL